MPPSIHFEQREGVAHVTLHYPKRFNAMSRAMWRQLRSCFESIQCSADVRCVLISGSGAHFCAGGDISEYTGFRFQEDSLRDFHENDVWGFERHAGLRRAHGGADYRQLHGGRGGDCQLL